MTQTKTKAPEALAPYDVLQVRSGDRWVDFATLRTPSDFDAAEKAVKTGRACEAEGEFRVVRAFENGRVVRAQDDLSILVKRLAMEWGPNKLPSCSCGFEGDRGWNFDPACDDCAGSGWIGTEDVDTTEALNDAPTRRSMARVCRDSRGVLRTIVIVGGFFSYHLAAEPLGARDIAAEIENFLSYPYAWEKVGLGDVTVVEAKAYAKDRAAQIVSWLISEGVVADRRSR